MALRDSSLSATNLATHHYLECDLYIHNIYHRREQHLSKANFKRGLDWERSCLLPFLDKENLLLTIPSTPVDGDTLAANIEADERDHFFVAGVEFWPSQELRQRFVDAGLTPVKFGLAKPDLLEIVRSADGVVTWKVVDAKASKTVKTSHHVQIYFYTLCLSYLLPRPFFKSSGSAAIWLPPAGGFDTDSIPSLEDLKSINVSLLAPSLDEYLFSRLPVILSLSRDNIDWHLNPLCRTCPFRSDCEKTVIEEGQLGIIPNISLAQVRNLKSLLTISRGTAASAVPDIEDLHFLLAEAGKIRDIEASYPVTVKKARRILAVQTSSNVVQRHNFTLPRREDIAVVISLIVDPSASKQGIAFFFISVHSSIPSFQPDSVHGPGALFITALSTVLRDILVLNAVVEPVPLTQFYVFSPGEYTVLQDHFINRALTTVPGSREDLRLCIDFMSSGNWSAPELRTHLERMGISISGTPDELRQRIEGEIQRLREEELGQLPRVVILKHQIEALLALPVPGYWDLTECALTILPPSSVDRFCPSDEELYDAYKMSGSLDLLKDKLARRNASIYAVLQNTRARLSASGIGLLVNDARVLSSNFMDICKEDTLRKLFFMQQFEVMAKLSELWKARIAGCPDAHILEYRETLQDIKGTAHIFHLISGGLDLPGGDKDKAFYGYIMTEDVHRAGDVPVEALFDDLSVCGLLFPPNKYTLSRWTRQNPIVQRKLIRQHISVTLQTWGGPDSRLVVGRYYRLSPRLVDFNITKILSTLVELDLRAAIAPEDSTDIPFLQLILKPGSFDSSSLIERGKEFIREENNIQAMFRTLRGLDGPDGVTGALVLKPSQHRAVQRIMTSRLSVLWGPPGTGKTYTIALGLLRLLEVQHRLGDIQCKIIFITAMTHAAIEAVMNKLFYLKDCYTSINSLPTGWLEDVTFERVLRGSEHKGPSRSHSQSICLYAGTVYQVGRGHVPDNLLMFW
ncbi:hypothetical protein B0H11DRAFT_2156635 [Mycena galericulata]|nr:hypothetical protein B0H11DRAFT_2156635 [Mycena galericulata]